MEDLLSEVPLLHSRHMNTLLKSLSRGNIDSLWSILSSRTFREWHSALVVKRVCFECFDCFMPLFYIAFYQLDVVTLRAEIVSLFMSKTQIET